MKGHYCHHPVGVGKEEHFCESKEEVYKMAVGGFLVWGESTQPFFLFFGPSVDFRKSLLVKVALLREHSMCNELWQKPRIT